MVTVLTRMAGGDGQEAGQEVAALWRQVQPAELLGRPVKEIDAYDLEVHHEITWRSVRGRPSYVERDHDLELRRLITEAARGTSHRVMPGGSSSLGKTRACYGAAHALPDDWRLWHPHRSRAPPGGIAELDRVGPRTVVWRNEAHHYLLHPDHGEQIAAALRTLLAGTTRAPILVLGTIWPRPGYFDEFADHSPVGQARTRHAHSPCPPPQEP
ncbi:hypothetical protein FBY34_7937 [Streptomyces sp. SLBN-115]|nr:hypothetical protein FBY34_7937 [Streptomyces sp. SLBN-115]